MESGICNGRAACRHAAVTVSRMEAERATGGLADYSILLAGLQALLEQAKTLRKMHAHVLAHNAELVAFADSVAQVRGAR